MVILFGLWLGGRGIELNHETFESSKLIHCFFLPPSSPLTSPIVMYLVYCQTYSRQSIDVYQMTLSRLIIKWKQINKANSL